MAALVVEGHRLRRAEEDAALAAERARLAAADAALAALDRACRLALIATLTAEGYHRPNAWRRRRVRVEIQDLARAAGRG